MASNVPAHRGAVSRTKLRAVCVETIASLLHEFDEDPDVVLHAQCLYHSADCLWVNLTEGPASELNLAAFTDTAFADVESADDLGRLDEILYEYVEKIEAYPTPAERHAAMFSVICHLVHRLAQHLPYTEATR